jgi:Lar family restriction alleviation protein
MNPFKKGDRVVYVEDLDDGSPPGTYDHVYVGSGIPTRALLVVTGTFMGSVSVACAPQGPNLTRGTKHPGGYLLGTLWSASLFRFAWREPRLLPCPFCGSADVVLARRNPHNDHVVVWCRGCCAPEVGGGTSVEQHAIDLWNRRTP